MAKLTFRYGVMSSGKSLKLLSEAYDLNQAGREVILLKPSIDTRTTNTIKSRLGVERECMVIDEDTCLLNMCSMSNNTVVLIDEAQFLTLAQVEELRMLASMGVEVICYGLLTTFQRKLFKGTQRLLELADDIMEYEGRCQLCGEKAHINARMVNGVITTTGNEVEIGDTQYISLCEKCYLENL